MAKPPAAGVGAAVYQSVDPLCNCSAGAGPVQGSEAAASLADGGRAGIQHLQSYAQAAPVTMVSPQHLSGHAMSCPLVSLS